jgi:DNA-binding transcriptional regulator YiaG
VVQSEISRFFNKNVGDFGALTVQQKLMWLSSMAQFAVGNQKALTSIKNVEFRVAAKFNGKKVRKLRKSLGLTQEKFSQLIAVSLDTVKKWESGKPNISPSTCRLLEMIEANPIFFLLSNLSR